MSDDVDRKMVFKVTAKLQAERALADDLAQDLEALTARLKAAGVGWFLERLDTDGSLARYREARR